MHKIALFLSYFGKFPNYFSLWLYSAGMNETIDFYILTDNEDIYEHGENVHFITCSLGKIQERLSRTMGYEVPLDSPYKLCDYRPAIGLLFADMLKDYHFWGYCDCDVVWGNLRSFITDEILSTYDKVFEMGHLTIFRNEERINKLFLDWKAPIIRSFYETSHLRDHVAFDEIGGLIPLNRIQAREGKLRIYNKLDVIGDIWYEETRFNTAWCKAIDTPHIYEYQQGELRALIADGDTVVRKPIIYVHLQKRPMEMKTDDISHFLIRPNAFVPPCEITTELIRQANLNSAPVYTAKPRPFRARLSLRNMIYKVALRHSRRWFFRNVPRAQGIELNNLHRLLSQPL